MKRFNFVLAFILVLLASFGCSSGSNAITPDAGDNFYPLTSASSTINANASIGETALAGANAFLYDLADNTLAGQTITNNMGIAQFGVTEGQYLLFIFTDTLYADPLPINVAGDALVNVDIELDNVLESTNSLYFGFITNEDDNTPVPWVEVSIGQEMTYSDGYGFYLLEAEAGATELTAVREGFKQKIINPREAQYADRNDYYNIAFFPLKPAVDVGTTLRGYIRDASFGNELGGAFVTLIKIQEQGQPRATYLTNIDGRYNFFNLIPGQYNVTARRDGFATESNSVIVNENEAIFNIYLFPDFNERASIQGYIIGPDGLGIGNARVVMTNPLLGKYETISEPGTGFYLIDEVVPGDYTILAVPPGTMFEPASTFVTMTDQDLDVSITCPSPLVGVLTGIITVAGEDPDTDLPPTGAKVVAEKIGSPFSGLKWTTHADTNGRYTINGIYTGAYRVEATLDYDEETHYLGEANNVVIQKGMTTQQDIEMSLS